MEDKFTEIERKFLIESFPESLPLKEAFTVHQAYISTEPEVRIRLNWFEDGSTTYYLAVKTNGEMVRQEIEIPISSEHFYALADTISYPFIVKEFRTYELPNGLELECSLVDKGLSTEFMYAEIEFQSTEEADKFVPCFDYVGEITRCADYKMKNFWKRTRGETKC